MLGLPRVPEASVVCCNGGCRLSVKKLVAAFVGSPERYILSEAALVHRKNASARIRCSVASLASRCMHDADVHCLHRAGGISVWKDATDIQRLVRTSSFREAKGEWRARCAGEWKTEELRKRQHRDSWHWIYRRHVHLLPTDIMMRLERLKTKQGWVGR